MKNLDYFIQIAESRLSDYGEFSMNAFYSECGYIIDACEEIDDNVTWDALKDALIQDGYYYNYQDESIVTPQVATDMGLDDEYWDDEEEDNEVDSRRILFQDTVSSIEKDFNEKFTINSAYLKSNNLKFHSFQLNEMNLIQLGKLVYAVHGYYEWTDDKEINELIDVELKDFIKYIETNELIDTSDYISLGHNIASIIIKNPKFDSYHMVDNRYVVYTLPTYLEVFNSYKEEIKEYIPYAGKVDITDEAKEAMAYEYINKVLLKYQ